MQLDIPKSGRNTPRTELAIWLDLTKVEAREASWVVILKYSSNT